ncbi:MAG: hypothetical protein KY457_13595, partial [Actinobacteria bacterium]|nr:hypothetical protein [Actinomycetota bacterium]
MGPTVVSTLDRPADDRYPRRDLPVAETWLSQDAYDRLQAELDELKTEGRPRISKEIEIARGHGDLKENAEYHSAKDEQGHMEAR